MLCFKDISWVYNFSYQFEWYLSCIYHHNLRKGNKIKLIQNILNKANFSTPALKKFPMMGYFAFTANTLILIIWMSHVVVWLKSHSFGSVILLKLWEDFAPIYCRDLFFKQFLPVIWLKKWGCSSYSPQMAETPANSGQTMRPPTLQFIFGFLFPATY